MTRRSIFDQIFHEMRNIRQRLDNIERNLANRKPKPLEVSEPEIANLPDHLRQTYIAVLRRGECTATEVSNETGRCRSVESNYLNQLLRMGKLNKRNASKECLFSSVLVCTMPRGEKFLVKENKEIA